MKKTIINNPIGNAAVRVAEAMQSSFNDFSNFEIEKAKMFEQDGLDMFDAKMPKQYIGNYKTFKPTVSDHSLIYSILMLIIMAMIIAIVNVVGTMDNIQEHLNEHLLEPIPTVVITATVAPVKADSVRPSTVPISRSMTVNSLTLPRNASGEFKTYMDYRTITDRTSAQYKLQGMARTNEYGFRKVGNYYCVAMGTFYGKSIGQKFLVTLESGREIPCVLGDVKDDRHTDKNHQYIPVNGNIVEFIVDKRIMDPAVLKTGDVSGLMFEGRIIKIERMK